MQAELEKIIKRLDDQVNKSLSGFNDLTRAERELYNFVSDFVASLKTGSARQRIDSLKVIERFRIELNKKLESGIYGSKVKAFAASFTGAGSIINDYFAALSVDFKSGNSLYKALLESNVQTTLQTMLGARMHASFTEPVIKLLKDNIAGNGSISDLRRKLLTQIVSQPDAPASITRYVNQVATDSIEQFTRNYINTISEDLGLNFYLYAGTEIKTTRKFCDERTGRYFTKLQVESWANLTWAGKIPETTKATIFTYCGGYNCRHRLLPVSKDIYEANKD
jgi:hypothetical protein